MFKILGICDNVNVCECCGKKNLKKTIAIEFLETSEIKYFGCVCAKQPIKGFDIKEIKRAENNYNNIVKDSWAMTYREYKRQGGTFKEKDMYSWEYSDTSLRDSIFNKILNELKNKNVLL